MSDRTSAATPTCCSGAMYAGVPRRAPVRVSGESGGSASEDSATARARGTFAILAQPGGRGGGDRRPRPERRWR